MDLPRARRDLGLSRDDGLFNDSLYSGGKYRSRWASRYRIRRYINRYLFIGIALILFTWWIFTKDTGHGKIRGSMESIKSIEPIPDTPIDIKVMVYNVWNFNDGDNWEARSEKIIEYIRAENPDFICFNEVRENILPSKTDEQTELTSMYVRLGRLLGSEYRGGFNVAMEYQDQGVREGVAFFTKLPFAKYHPKILRHDYPDPNDGNERQIIHIPIDISNNQGKTELVHFFVTHWSYQLYDQFFNAEDTIAYFKELNLKPLEDKILYMGDLNVVTVQTQINDDECRHQGYDLNNCPRHNLAPLEKLFDSEYKLQDSFYAVHGKDASDSDSLTFCNCKIRRNQIPMCKRVGRIDRILGSPPMRFVATSVGGASTDSIGSDGKQQSTLCPSDHLYYTTTITLFTLFSSDDKMSS